METRPRPRPRRPSRSRGRGRGACFSPEEATAKAPLPLLLPPLPSPGARDLRESPRSSSVARPACGASWSTAPTCCPSRGRAPPPSRRGSGRASTTAASLLRPLPLLSSRSTRTPGSACGSTGVGWWRGGCRPRQSGPRAAHSRAEGVMISFQCFHFFASEFECIIVVFSSLFFFLLCVVLLHLPLCCLLSLYLPSLCLLSLFSLFACFLSSLSLSLSATKKRKKDV